MGHEYERLLPGNKQAMRNITMNNTQFEQLKSQLKLLTPQQLRSLQGAIHHSLGDDSSTLLTDEEMDVIAGLFS